MPAPGPRSAPLVLVVLACIVALALLLGPSPPSLAQGTPAEPTRQLPFNQLYIPLVMRAVGQPFPTDDPPPPTDTPTATSTRRPTITPTPSATATNSPTATRTATQTATLAPGVTPSRTLTPTVTPTRTVTTTPTPGGQVVVATTRAFTFNAGTQPYVSVVGEVRNQGETAVEAIVVTVTLLRDDLLPLQTAAAEVFAPRLAPGQSAPFRLTVERPADYDNAQATVTGWAWTTAAPLAALAAPTNTGQTAGATPTLLGRVVNTSGAPIRHVRVVAVFRDAGGVANVVDSGQGADSPYGLTLDPGGSAPFSLRVAAGPVPGAPEYHILYDVSPTAAPPALSISGERTERAGSHLDLFGEVENTTGSAIRETQIIASFYDAADHLVAADWVWASQNADRILNPGQRAPFQVTLDGASASAWTRYTVQTFHRAAPALLPGGANLDAPSFQVALDYQSITLRGRVVNGTAVTLRQPRLVVTFVKDGKVQYALSAEVPEAANLAPGQTADYTVSQFLPQDVGRALVGVDAHYALDFLP